MAVIVPLVPAALVGVKTTLAARVLPDVGVSTLPDNVPPAGEPKLPASIVVPSVIVWPDAQAAFGVKVSVTGAFTGPEDADNADL